MAYPLLSSRLVLEQLLSKYYSDFDLSLMIERLDGVTPWVLLNIFLMNKPFSSDYEVYDKKTGLVVRVFKNANIAYYFEGMANALRERSTDLGKHLPKVMSVSKFYYEPGNGGTSQGKLTYSLLYFSLLALRKGYTKIVEVGAGEELGGVNHMAVCSILQNEETNVGKLSEIVMIDPLMKEQNESVCGTVLNRQCRAVGLKESFVDPVYCDVFNEQSWSEIQETLVSPLKMLKCIYPEGKRNILLQPYHTEVRIIENDQFEYVLRAAAVDIPGFCSCSNCLLWKALCLEFHIAGDSVSNLFPHIGLQPCQAIIGAGTVKAMYMSQATKMVVLHRDLSDNPTIMPKSKRVVEKHIQVEMTVWESNMLTFLKQFSESFTEINHGECLRLDKFGSGKLFIGNGIPFFS